MPDAPGSPGPQVAGHQILDDSVLETLDLSGHLVAEFLVERLRLKAERFQIQQAAASLAGTTFKLSNQASAQPTETAAVCDPQLPELAAFAPGSP